MTGGSRGGEEGRAGRVEQPAAARGEPAMNGKNREGEDSGPGRLTGGKCPQCVNALELSAPLHGHRFVQGLFLC